MSKRSVSCFLGLFLSGPVTATPGLWQGVSPVPPSLSAVPSQHWYIGDTGGTGGGFGQGKSREALQDVSFINERVGAAIGYSGALRTEDGGLTWRELPIGPVMSAEGKEKGTNWYAIRMVTSEEIWALGHIHPGGLGRTRLTRSLDSGRTWEDLLVGQVSHAARLQCPNPHDRWVICGAGPSFHSADGGATWRQINWGVQAWICDIGFPGDVPPGDIGYAAGFPMPWSSDGCVLKTEDGGDTWKRLELPPRTSQLSRLCFPTSRQGWVGGRDGQILHTEDGGATWETRSLPVKQTVTGLVMFATGHGYASVYAAFGPGRMIDDWTLFSTGDGGRTWQPQLGGWKSLHALCTLGPSHLWSVGVVPGFIPNDLVVILE